MNALGTGPTTVLDPTYGSVLVGVIVAAMFQGMLMVQAYNYFENFRNDRMKNKVTVLLVVIAMIALIDSVLDTVHLILICKAAYASLVTNWGFMPSLGFAPIELNLHLIFTALSCLVAQLFFLERIWTFSRRNIVTTLSLLILALAPVVLEIYITTLIVRDTSVAEYQRNKDVTMSLFVLTAVADMSIAGVMCYYLQREKSSFEATRSVVSKALHIVVGSGLATSLVAIISLILLVSLQNTFYFIALHFQLGRTYTNALLLTLNARQQMRMILRGGETYRSTHLSNQMELGAVPAAQGTTGEVGNIVCIVSKHTITDVIDDDKWHGRERHASMPEIREQAYSTMDEKISTHISFVEM